MAIKEARCTNCGSILMTDPTGPTVKCMFCRAVVDTQEALAVAADPTGYVFPNEPQPDEDTNVNAASLYNKALKQAQGGKPAQGAVRTAQAKKAPARTGVQIDNGPRAQVEKIEMPSAKLSNAAKLKIVATLAIILLVTTAAVLPVTLIRDAHRSSLTASIGSILPSSFQYNGAASYAIAKTGNTSFSVVSTADVDTSTALQVFKSYCETRADIYGLDPASDSFSSVYGKVTVRVIGPNGGFEVTGLKTPADLQDPGKVRAMG